MCACASVCDKVRCTLVRCLKQANIPQGQLKVLIGYYSTRSAGFFNRLIFHKVSWVF